MTIIPLCVWKTKLFCQRQHPGAVRDHGSVSAYAASEERRAAWWGLIKLVCGARRGISIPVHMTMLTSPIIGSLVTISCLLVTRVAASPIETQDQAMEHRAGEALDSLVTEFRDSSVYPLILNPLAVSYFFISVCVTRIFRDLFAGQQAPLRLCHHLLRQLRQRRRHGGCRRVPHRPHPGQGRYQIQIIAVWYFFSILYFIELERELKDLLIQAQRGRRPFTFYLNWWTDHWHLTINIHKVFVVFSCSEGLSFDTIWQFWLKVALGIVIVCPAVNDACSPRHAPLALWLLWIKYQLIF